MTDMYSGTMGSDRNIVTFACHASFLSGFLVSRNFRFLAFIYLVVSLRRIPSSTTDMLFKYSHYFKEFVSGGKGDRVGQCRFSVSIRKPSISI